MSKVTDVQALRGDKRNRLISLLAHGIEPGRAWEIVAEPGEDVEPNEFAGYGRLAKVLYAKEIAAIDPRPQVTEAPTITRELLSLHAERAMQTAVADRNLGAVAGIGETVRALAGIERDKVADGRPPVKVEITK